MSHAAITRQKNVYLLSETFGVLMLCFVVGYGFSKLVEWSLFLKIIYGLFLLFQGLWFYRLYIVAHEASHRKLFPDQKWVNDFWGSVALIPLMVPVNVYRKIHMFHHGFNRKDPHTSALDTFVVKGRFKKIKHVWFTLIWYVNVFLGGFFIHSLISVLLFLFIPVSWSLKISPAFKGWTIKDQFTAMGLFLMGVGLHLAVYSFFGGQVYAYTLGYPLLSFAWVLSLLVYIFHYDTSMGEETRFHVRSVRHVPFFSWVLMNFNEHATHHQYPNIPWYQLPEKREELPAPFLDRNQNTRNFFKAIFNQLKGPNIIHE